MTYYKATRLDGTDFFSGRIDYAAACGTGEAVRPLPHKGMPRLCGPGYLHAADAPAETLLGGSWPCRLFEVEGKPVEGFDKWHPHMGGFLELRVVRELPAWQALGPNGKQVAALIERDVLEPGAHGPVRYGRDLVREFELRESRAVRKCGGRADWEGLERAVREAAVFGAPFSLDEWLVSRSSVVFRRRKLSRAEVEGEVAVDPVGGEGVL